VRSTASGNRRSEDSTLVVVNGCPFPTNRCPDPTSRDAASMKCSTRKRQVKRRLKAMRDRFADSLDALGLRDGENAECDNS